MTRVRSGLDRWIEDGSAALGLGPGARIGLLAHPASVDRRAVHVLEWIAATRAVRLERVFAPEHGLWGHEQDMETVAGGVEPLTGAPLVSLYGDHPRTLRPAASDVAGLDAIVADLQDVGARYYTFVYTLAYAMEAAGEAGVPVIVLDRPNPIGGERIAGPVLEPALRSFVGRYPLPVRHGMTPGELARLFRGAFGVRCELRVVPLDGWSRSMRFEATGLPWIPPSPNMPSPRTAEVYPGGCLVEGTNLSEGRGTTLPFELVGAPWLDELSLARRLRDRAPAGARFRAASFRPMFQKHAGRACRGVQVLIEDADLFEPFATYLTLLAEARAADPGSFAWRAETYEFESDRPAIDFLLGRTDLRPALEQGVPVEDLVGSWRAELERFGEMRREFLLY